MPRLSEVRAELVSALIGPGSPLPPRLDDTDPFRQLVFQWVQWVVAVKAAPAHAALVAEGWDDAANLAGADPADVIAVLAAVQVKVNPRDVLGLIGLARWAVAHDFGPATAPDWSTTGLRDAWREIRGLSPPTVDALLARGLGRPAYPVDRGSYRVMIRHGWIDTTADYDEARAALESLADDDPTTLVAVSEALPRVGRTHCRPAAPRCEGCPLRPWLPEGGPLGGE